MLVISLFCGGDLLLERFVCIVLQFQQVFQLVITGVQLQQDGIGLRAFDFQLQLDQVQLGTGGFQFSLFCIQSCLGLFHSPRCFPHFLQTALVSLGDLLDHLQTVQQVREAIGLEQNGPVGQLTVFLHRPDTLFVLSIELFVECLCCIQLILLVGDQQTVSDDLLIDVIHLLVQQAHFIFNAVFLGNDLLDLGHIVVDLAFQLVDLFLDLVPIGLQVVEFLLQFSRGSGANRGNDAGQQAQQHDRRHNTGKN